MLFCDCKYRDGEKLKRFVKNSKYTQDEVIEKLEKEKNEFFSPKARIKNLQKEIDKHAYEIEILQKELNEQKLKSNN